MVNFRLATAATSRKQPVPEYTLFTVCLVVARWTLTGLSLCEGDLTCTLLMATEGSSSVEVCDYLIAHLAKTSVETYLMSLLCQSLVLSHYILTTCNPVTVRYQ